MFDGSQTIWQSDGCQSMAVSKSIFVYNTHTIRNGDRGQVSAISESALPYGRQAVWQSYGCQSTT
jgi:hypothetical protein